ncbi:hypothetical protein [Halobacterium sp. KA-6]|uniref:hypothetical protein n=1 Tax=Halobacterium sp. KA-6 TaxID=2896368 RepID=UPI001E3507C8|nr:hypothetical protein [Halobacterium sp. KA-6]MCD2202813.1 hypothetical protein [Halobacterium sp. KA-6]
MPPLSGRQTQFYIDVVYGVAFSLGFGYLLVFGMDARVAALQGGLVLGYFLRVWENMSIYEQILEEQVAQAAETKVAAEVDDQVSGAVADEVETHVEDHVEEHVDDRVQERVEEEVEEHIEDADPRQSDVVGDPSA